MIKVIKYGNKRRIQCQECGSLIEYEEEDIRISQTSGNGYEGVIDCPVCKKIIAV